MKPTLLKTCILAVFLAASTASRADVGLVLNSSMGTGSSFITSGGHASLYLSRICPAGPVQVRLCAPGEQGSVLSNYSNFHEDKPYAWNIIPVSIFLYGVEDPSNRPLFASPTLQTTLRLQYLKTRLTGPICASDDCQKNLDANWQDMVAATFLRTVYIFEVKTTPAQDLDMIRRLNASANVNHYHGVSNNCADFVRNLLNSYFPNAIQSHRFADFYLTSPKTTARSLVHYAERHPDLNIRVTRFAQLPSEIRRSDPARSGMETVITTKKFLLPMLFRPEELAAISVSYLITDRFSAERSSRKHAPDADLDALQLSDPPATPDAAFVLATYTPSANAAMSAPPHATWKHYQSALSAQEDQAREAGVITGVADLAHAFRDMGRDGTPQLDARGRPWMEMPVLDRGPVDHGAVTHAIVGLTVSAVKKSSNEDSARLAYKFQLARVRFYLHSHGMDREALPEFVQDWALLQSARESLLNQRENAAIAAATQRTPAAQSARAPASSASVVAVSTYVEASR